MGGEANANAMSRWIYLRASLGSVFSGRRPTSAASKWHASPSEHSRFSVSSAVDCCAFFACSAQTKLGTHPTVHLTPVTPSLILLTTV